MVDKVNIGLIQYAFPNSTEKAITETCEKIAEAANKGAQIICLQELFNTPYFCMEQNVDLFDLAEPIPGPTVERMQAVAKKHKVVLIVPIFEKRAAGIYHNSAAIIDADGSLLGTYRKMHIPQDPGFEEKFYFTPGDLGYQAWETRYGKIGVLICWDQWYPEAARLTAMAGAQILFYPTAIGWLPKEKPSLGKAQHTAWETVQRGHAVANGCYVAAVNRCGTEGETEFWGQSFVANPYGEVLQRAPVSNESILIQEVDFKAVEDFRRIWPFFRDRRIDSFGDISKVALD